MTRYHPFLVALHWLLALMILVSLLIGGPALEQIPNSDPGKIAALGGHMGFGLAILALMIVRLVVRSRTQKPPHARTGNSLLDLLGKLSHWAFYVLVILVTVSGMGIARGADLFAIAYGGSGAPLPEDFWHIGARTAHGILTKLLLALIALHLAGWAYHQFILRDGLLRRMWFGKRD